jgi:hypothetical protein
MRNPDAVDLETRDGAFMSPVLPIAGFAVIEAPDLAEATEKVSPRSRRRCARCGESGPLEYLC